MSGKDAIKLVANNKKAYHDYFIEEKYEAGIELFGTEVKSIRQGKCGCFFFSSLLPFVPEIRSIPVTPEIPAKKELMTKLISLCLKRLMPMASAATSSSRMALKARP